MSGDYARWLANETAAALTHDKPADPFDRIPDPDASYRGTILETTAELGQRAACPEPDRDERASWPSADELAEMSMHDQMWWEQRCADAEAAATLTAEKE